VRLIGVADRALAGRPVDMVFSSTGKVVARATVAPDGTFETTAPLPPAKLRGSDRARYQARVAGQRSLNLKLVRRMQVSRLRSSGTGVTISGRVLRPLAARAKDRAIIVQRVVTCSKAEDVARVTPRADGTFSVTVPAPAGQRAAVYRLRTLVRTSPTSGKVQATFTLPRAVAF
jgi:hypothetical protein